MLKKGKYESATAMDDSEPESSVKRKGNLEIGQDAEFQSKDWIAQRIGWVLMGLILLSAFLGLFGPGPLSSVTKTSDDGGLYVSYNRFWRWQSPAQIRFRVRPELLSQGKLDLEISKPLLHSIRIEGISPEPDSVTDGAGRRTYTFRAQPGEQELEAVIHFVGESFGPISGSVGVPRGPRIGIELFLYP